MATAQQTTPDVIAQSFARKLSEEIDRFSTQLLYYSNDEINTNGPSPTVLSSTTLDQWKGNQQLHHKFISEVNNKIISTLSLLLRESKTSGFFLKLSNIHYLKSILLNSISGNINITSSSNNNKSNLPLSPSSSPPAVLTLQQQIGYLLALYNITIISVEETPTSIEEKNAEGKKTNSEDYKSRSNEIVENVVQFIHSFLLHKFELYLKSTNNTTTVTNDGKTNTDAETNNTDITNAFGDYNALLLRKAMVLYMSFLEFILLLSKKDQDNNPMKIAFQNDQNLTALLNKMESEVMDEHLPKTVDEFSQDRGGETDIATSVDRTEHQQQPALHSSLINTFLDECNVPDKSKEQLKELYENDYESFQCLLPYLKELHNQNQRQRQHPPGGEPHKGASFSTCSTSLFVRPLPPMSTFTNDFDLFDYDYNISKAKTTTASTKSSNAALEMKEEEEFPAQDEENSKPAISEDNSNITEIQEYYNNLLFFLHPADPYLRFMYMNTESSEIMIESSPSSVLITESSVDHDNDNGDVDTLDGNYNDHNDGHGHEKGDGGNAINEKDIIDTLKEAFVRPLDVDAEEKIIQLLTSAMESLSATTPANTASSPVGAVKPSMNHTQNKKKSKRRNSKQQEELQSQEQNYQPPLFQQMLSMLTKCGLTPLTLPTLVKFNHTLANKCLLILLSAEENVIQNDRESIIVSSSLKKEYLSALVGMDMSLESMEVVYQLATHSCILSHNQYPRNFGNSSNDEDDDVNQRRTEMSSRGAEKKRRGKTRKKSTAAQAAAPSPKQPMGSTPLVNTGSFLLNTEYIHMFVTNCISSCENTQDRNRQFKYVRLLSVFLQTLIQKNIVHVEVSSIINTWWLNPPMLFITLHFALIFQYFEYIIHNSKGSLR